MLGDTLKISITKKTDFPFCRCKMRQRDPRLFYLSMEVTVRRASVRTVLVLDDEARPAILQACHPKGDSK